MKRGSSIGITWIYMTLSHWRAMNARFAVSEDLPVADCVPQSAFTDGTSFEFGPVVNVKYSSTLFIFEEFIPLRIEKQVERFRLNQVWYARDLRRIEQ
jgi:hypothetical protein